MSRGNRLREEDYCRVFELIQTGISTAEISRLTGKSRTIVQNSRRALKSAILGDDSFVGWDGMSKNVSFWAQEFVKDHPGMKGTHCAKTSDDYNRGLEAAWQLANDITKLTLTEIEKIYNMRAGSSWADVLSLNVQEAKEKFMEYKRKKSEEEEIHVGDEVSFDRGRGFVFKIGINTFQVVRSSGGTCFVQKDKATKTGRHLPVKEWLSEM